MPEQHRRSGESEYEDPASQSLVRKASKMEIPGGPVVDALIRVIITLAVGGGAGYVSNEHSNANDAVAYEQLTALKSDFDKFKTNYYERQRIRTEQSQKDREELLQRLTKIETRIDLLRRR